MKRLMTHALTTFAVTGLLLDTAGCDKSEKKYTSMKMVRETGPKLVNPNANTKDRLKQRNAKLLWRP